MEGGAGSLFDLRSLERAGFAFQPRKAGETIFATDDEGDTMYAVRSGLVEITAYGEVLDRVGPGGYFGEMALIDGSPRSATATVVKDSEVAAISRADFLQLVRSEPTFALEIMRVLARRLRDMNENL